MTIHAEKSFNKVAPTGVSNKGLQAFAYKQVINEICDFDWANLSATELTNVGWAYYYFSTQFRECLEVARSLYPDDDRLLQLDQGERDTDNLSPWPGVAKPGEKMNHDEFMRRTLELEPISDDRRRSLVAIGQSYLTKVRSIDANTHGAGPCELRGRGTRTGVRSHSKSSRLERSTSTSIQAFPR